MRELNIKMDKQSIPTWATRISNSTYERSMKAKAPLIELDVPSEANYVVIAARDMIWISESASIDFANETSWLSQNTAVSRVALYIKGIPKLYFRSFDDNYLHISFYK